MNFNESGEGYLEGFGWKKGENIKIKLKSQKKLVYPYIPRKQSRYLKISDFDIQKKSLEKTKNVLCPQNLSTWKARVRGLQCLLGKPRLQYETLSQNTNHTKTH